jgi:hypothetical protein
MGRPRTMTLDEARKKKNDYVNNYLKRKRKEDPEFRRKCNEKSKLYRNKKKSLKCTIKSINKTSILFENIALEHIAKEIKETKEYIKNSLDKYKSNDNI